MKTKLSLLVAVIVLSSNAFGQFTFGVSPGIKLNSAYFGYKIKDKIVPYVGFQFMNVSFNVEETGERFDYDQNKVVAYSDKTDFSGTLSLPNLGVKYFFLKKNKIQSYFSISVSKAFISGKLKSNDTEDVVFNTTIKSINMWGGEFGFGMEYFFDKNFSLGGEFGFRQISLKSHESFEYEFYNPNTDNFQTADIVSDLKFKMSPTYSKLSLNFYF